MFTQADLKDLRIVEGCSTEDGTWVEAVGPGAANVAMAAAGMIAPMWIQTLFDQGSQEAFLAQNPNGRIPHVYMLLDDPQNPTTAPISVVAIKGNIWDDPPVLIDPQGGMISGPELGPIDIDALFQNLPAVRDLVKVEDLVMYPALINDYPVDEWTLIRSSKPSGETKPPVKQKEVREGTTRYDVYDEKGRIIGSVDVSMGVVDMSAIRADLIKQGVISEKSTYFSREGKIV